MSSIYVHIPYCVSKCSYCDFYSTPSPFVPQEYVDAIVKNISLCRLPSVDTLYFGGGTPSLLTPLQVKQIISSCTMSPAAEITLEANPDSVTLEKMTAFKKAGINRISLGVQTAHDDSLKRIGRIHSKSSATQALESIANAGFENISGDIMLSLPHYTKAEFDHTLQLLIGGKVTHISCYMLKIEPATPFGINLPQGLLNDDQQADIYLYAVAALEKAGYHQYEISNFAKDGFESRHNLVYWDCFEYYGIGAAAHSCVDNIRYFYPDSACDFINGGTKRLDGKCDANDYIMLQLRLNKGLDLQKLKELWGYELSQIQLSFLRQCEQTGYAILTKGKVRLTLRGMLLQNSILAQLL